MDKINEEKLFIVLAFVSLSSNKRITFLQKSILIYQKEYDPNSFLFVPSNYGANSFVVKEAINFLENRKFISENDGIFAITFIGNELLGNIKDKYSNNYNIVEQITKFTSTKTLTELIEYTYIIYKDTTTNSLIYKDVFKEVTNDRIYNAEEARRLLREDIQKK